MMEPLFHVIAEGRPTAGFESAAVAEQLVSQLRISTEQAQRLLGGSPIIAKRGVTRDIAQAYCTRLNALGLEVRIEPSPVAQPAIVETSSLSVVTESVAQFEDLADFFRDLATPLPHLRSARHAAAITGIGLQALGIVLVYVGLVALAAAVLIAYTLSFYYLLAAPPLLFSIPVFLIPWLLLLALNVLLLRPLLPMSRTETHATPLNAAQQPRLFYWLKQLCERIAVPMPGTVVLSIHTAHAMQIAEERGALRRAGYRLALSLPLLDVAALRASSATTAASLAVHGRANTLRSQWLLKKLRERFNACLEQRDPLGVRLARGPARRLLELNGRLLQPIALRLDRLQGCMSRRMTLETDRIQIALIGSTAFIDDLLQQHNLEQAWRDACALNDDDRAVGLAANLPALIRHYYDHFDASAEARLRKQWSLAARRGADDTPPAPAERAEAAHAQDSAGVLPSHTNTESDAAPLLDQHDDELELQATIAFYRDNGLTMETARLLSIETLTFAASEDLLRREQSTQYFNNWFRPFRFWRLADHELLGTLPIADAVQQLNVCVNEIRRLTPDRARLLNEYERLQNQMLDLLTAQQVLAQAKPYAFRYAQHENAPLQPQLEDCQQQLMKVMEGLSTQEAIMGGRIGLGLRLCGAASAETERLQRALALASGIEQRLYRLSLDTQVLEQLVQRRDEQRETCYAIAIRRLEEKIEDATALLYERLKDMPHPTDARYPTVADFIKARLPDRDAGTNSSATLERTRVLLQSLYTLNETLSASAASFATTAEEAYSIESIRLVTTGA